jgi:integrase
MRSRAKGTSPPKTAGDRETIADLVFAASKAKASQSNFVAAAKALIAEAGSTYPENLAIWQVTEATETLSRFHTPTTKSCYCCSLRQVLRWLWEEHGAPKLDGSVPHFPGIRPRNVTTNRATIEALLGKASLAMQMLILLCSDLAIRSGTAIKIGPRHYNQEARTLQFRTKMDEALTLPTTDSIESLISRCDLNNPRPFITQLHDLKLPKYGRRCENAVMSLKKLRSDYNEMVQEVSPAKRITFHDLRRTAAVRMYEQTGDLRIVQALLGHRSLPSTIWYLDHDLRPVSRATLELIKRPPGPERKLA